MADLQKLANDTVAIKPTLDPGQGMPAAARLAVKRAGITNQNDVNRLSRQILQVLSKRSATKRSMQSKKVRHTH